ncbi:hypothetical protein [Sphingomonas sp. M1-B02]|uniref:hypothetical protein n=1 Tax=Sphingomonas sp. M1-B02 TaxID=3114300 RepID=UPI00223FE01F|nr:hypothetical protein [Sphingomonas sp. S6-11]UZK67422.1 hypothetical protein OKW87_06210 [Sphingomonas sp. S6-11]
MTMRLGWLDKGTIALLAFALAVTAYLCFAGALFNDGDTSWHLAAGRLILATGAVPQGDPFSFTFAGHAWTAHEWLAEVVMAGVYRLAAWGGLAVLFAGAVGALILLLGGALRRWLPMRRVVIALTLVVAMLAPFILARPHVLAWPLLAGWTILLLRAREEMRPPPILAALLMVVWANLHASFIVGLGLVGVFALEALIDEPDKRRVVLGWGVFGVTALAASLLTPHLGQGLLYPLQVSGMKALPLIQEWRRTDPAQDWLFLAVVAGTVLLVAVRRPRLAVVRWLLLAAILYLAFAHVRHQPLVAILGVLLLARPLGSAAPPHSARASLLGFALGLLLIAAIRVPLALPRQDSESNPVTAIAQLPAELRARPLLNSYGFGGPLILAGIRPYIDGRGDMYGDAFLFEHQRIVDGDAAAFARAVRRWGIGWTMLSPDAPLVAALDRAPAWQRIYADRWAVVHVRR